ncbi:hypothetical protein MSC49_39710 (plasmid) [Methylosinus sp. C49]|nr:hypothetical protein MSC49_39710 [Methylosinus sp. C49]
MDEELPDDEELEGEQETHHPFEDADVGFGVGAIGLQGGFDVGDFKLEVVFCGLDIDFGRGLGVDQFGEGRNLVDGEAGGLEFEDG